MIAGDKKTEEQNSNVSLQNEDALNIDDEINELLEQEMDARDEQQESQSKFHEVGIM